MAASRHNVKIRLLHDPSIPNDCLPTIRTAYGELGLYERLVALHVSDLVAWIAIARVLLVDALRELASRQDWSSPSNKSRFRSVMQWVSGADAPMTFDVVCRLLGRETEDVRERIMREYKPINIPVQSPARYCCCGERLHPRNTTGMCRKHYRSHITLVAYHKKAKARLPLQPSLFPFQRIMEREQRPIVRARRPVRLDTQLNLFERGV